MFGGVNTCRWWSHAGSAVHVPFPSDRGDVKIAIVEIYL